MKELWKTASWAAVSGVIIWASVYFDCFDWRLATVATVWAVGLKTPAYFVHEHVWSFFERKGNAASHHHQ